jgi:hypothetical protein
MEQLELLAVALKTLSETTVTYLEFERAFEDGNWTRQQLEKSAKLREVYFNDETSDYNLYDGIRADMRSDLLHINSVIADKIHG